MKVLYVVDGKQFDSRKDAENYENTLMKKMQTISGIKKQVEALNEALERNRDLVGLTFNPLTAKLAVVNKEQAVQEDKAKTKTDTVKKPTPTKELEDYINWLFDL